MPLRLRLPSSSLLARGVAAIVVVAAATALAGSGIQITPDRNRTLVSKDLAGERWAITCEEDGTISGNVFRPDGGLPAFVWCEPVSDDGNPDPYERIFALDCYGADACVAAPCAEEEWRFIATVPLMGAFCLPPATMSTPVPTATPEPDPTSTPIVMPPTPTPVRTPTPTAVRTATPRPTATRTPRPVCCRRCTTGKPCGDSCINRNLTCHQPPGCACSG